jgi:type I restriction enzyme R subunit
MKATSEEAFETLIVEHLTGHGYLARPNTDYDADLALLPDDLLGYIEETQPKSWAKQEQIHGPALRTNVLAAFDKATKDFGVLHVIRHGFKFYGSTLRVATFRPAHGLNPEVEALYQANRLAVVRQVHHDPKQPGLELDIVLFLNGIPIVTCELKNAMTSQKAGHAIKQYKHDRDPDAPMFRFKRRALVHFAVGSDEVWMTTRLRGSSTFFLPFNKGRGTGAGNPPAGDKHRTHYLWEEVWERHSLLDIVARFIHLQVEEKEDADGKVHKRETMIFPRYHQLDAVRKLLASAKVKGPGTHYLVQHSAGSGKSNSIAWLAHRLASLHDDHDRKVYDGVVVLTDRRVLDQQLQNTIYQFDHKAGVVRRIREDGVKSTQLAEALTENAPIIICTLHSFGFVADKLDALPDRRYAVLVDEAHSSQGGDMAKAVRDIIGIPDEEDEDEAAIESDKLAKWSAERRRLPKNMSYFAFTATPKFKTVCLFGTEVGKNPDTGQPIYEPFHVYSMRQAIEEGFILDVLRGYTTYTTYFKLVKSIADDPELDKKKASRALARFVSFHPHNVAQKTEVMVEHFRSCVMHRLGGRAKAMVVTGSRLHAVRYKQAFDKYVAEKGYTDIGTLVAFSGEVKDDVNTEITYTEPEMNADPRTGKPLKESELPRAFGSDNYNVLVVANKYQTGFDQPLLCAMYVDKRLSGIQAVQTLSRLNRTHAGKEETLVLDFVNEREEVLQSFQTFYEGTTVLETVDPQRLYELQGKLDATQVYYKHDVDRFARVFFKPLQKQRPGDNAAMNAALDPSVDRFKDLEEEPAEEFRKQLQAFINLYGFMAQIVPFSDADLEKLYVFGKMLLRKLPSMTEASPRLDLGEDVAMHYYRLQKVVEGNLLLAADGSQELYGPKETGTGKVNDDTEKLSTLIGVVNDRFGTDFDAQDLLDGVTKQLLDDASVQQAAAANDRANFDYVGGPALEDALVERHAKHGDFINEVFADSDILAFLKKKVLDEVYAKLSGSS